MSNFISFFEMRPWIAECVQTKDENDLLIKGVLADLKGLEPGANSVMVGGDTLIFGSVDDNGDYIVYECSIRRSSANVALKHPTATDGSVN